MSYSSIRWLYWLTFAVCIALIVALNLPWPGLPPANPGALLNDAWFLWGFNYFGLLIMPMAALMIDDGRRRGMKWPLYVIPYFAIGIIPLSVFLARRPAIETQQRPTPRLLEQRWVWVLLALGVVVISIIFLPRGSAAQLTETMLQNPGLSFMWLDIALNHLAALPLAQADMQRRGAEGQTLWLAAIALSGPIGLCLWMALRPPASRVS